MLDSSQTKENAAISNWAQRRDYPLYSEAGAGLASVLVANAPSSINMVFGVASALWVNYLIRGLDINSRVVFNVDNAEAGAELMGILRGDLRLSVHHQDHTLFLDDIRHHELNLVIIDSGLGQAVFNQAVALLSQAGYAIVLGPIPVAWSNDELFKTEIPIDGNSITLLTRASSLAMPRKRRGGRKVRRTNG